MARDPYKYFRIEARELLEQLGKGTLDLEREGEGAELVQKLLRLAHTLKGAARVVRQPEIADDSHEIEELLAPHRESRGRVSRGAIDGILKHLDSIGAHLAGLAPAAPLELAVPGRGVPEDVLRTVRADVTEVDALLDGLAEIYIQVEALRRATGDAKRARRLGEVLAEQLGPRGRDNARTGADSTLAVAHDNRTIVGTLERTIGAAVERIDGELRQVRDLAEHLRLVPAGSLFTSLERTARDTARSLGKQVMFEGRGGDVRMDAHVLGAVQPALVQMVRNAVAHGIEAVADRTASGKPAAGRVRIEIVRRGRRVVFRCGDDGRGIDVEAVRRTAALKGLSLREQEDPGSEELVGLLLRGGISTSAAVTEVSGRGVGLDVVREAIERLGGRVEVQTRPGQGTDFEMIVPLSLASIEALCVETAGVVATLPLDAVRHTLRLARGDVSRTAEGECIRFEGRVIPFVPMARALRIPRRTGSAAPVSEAPVIIVAAGDRMAALGVDRIVGTGKVVLRPLPDLAPVDRIVAGASLDAEGNPQIVLDPEGIIDAAAGTSTPIADADTARVPVLVIDDSLTTRMLEQSILESAGYDVDLATSAEEGLEAARRKTYRLFLVDVEMPGMDGFSFIERIRADPRLAAIPAILVTSRAAPEDRERGERAGAQGYVIKSEFDQTDLLARIKRLVSQ